MHRSPTEIRQLRFFVGVTIAVILAFGFNWPLAFITPMFVAKFLGTTKPKLPFKVLSGIFMITASAFIFGGIVTSMLINYPIVFLLAMTLIIFWISYWNNSGGNELAITMLLVGFTLIPMLTLLLPVVAFQVSIGFLFSCCVSLLLTMIMHEIIPDKKVDAQTQAKVITPIADKPTRVRYALLSTLMIMPVVTFFFYFNLSSAILILAFIAILAQKPDLVAGIKGSAALMIGNSIGGIVAIALYAVLILVPNFTMLNLLMGLTALYFSQLIFSENKFAPVYAMAFSTVIILISSATSSDADANEKFYIRLLQIAAACGYVVFATIIAMPWIKKISLLDTSKKKESNVESIPELVDS